MIQLIIGAIVGSLFSLVIAEIYYQHGDRIALRSVITLFLPLGLKERKMSILHLRQICSYLENNYLNNIQLTKDELRKSDPEIQNIMYTRTLFALSISMVTGILPNITCEFIPDGYDRR